MKSNHQLVHFFPQYVPLHAPSNSRGISLILQLPYYPPRRYYTRRYPLPSTITTWLAFLNGILPFATSKIAICHIPAPTLALHR